MNSFESIHDCMKSGAPVIEVDVNFTADGIPVLTHWFAPDGEIMFMTAPTLQEFLAAEYPLGHHPMTLDALMALSETYGGHIFIDFKMGEERRGAGYMAACYPRSANKKVIFQVHDRKFLRELYKKDVFGSLHYNADIATLELLLPYLQRYGVHTVSVSDWEVADEKSLRLLKDAGVHVYVYTVNHRRRMERLFACGADGVFTDRYAELAEGIEEK